MKLRIIHITGYVLEVEDDRAPARPLRHRELKKQVDENRTDVIDVPGAEKKLGVG